MDSFNFQPIGYFKNSLNHPNEAPRQPNKDLPETSGTIVLKEGHSFQDALRDLEGFSHIWILFQFHKNDHWNPAVAPPRGSLKKRGVFATRSPYRPNPIGMSILELKGIQNLTLTVGPSDLLNETPVFDIKPYLPYVDAIPETKIGWLEELNAEKYQVLWSAKADEQIQFLESLGLTQLRGFILNQLEYDPKDPKKKRLYFLEDRTLLAYRTWRAEIQSDDLGKLVTVVAISSGYSPIELGSKDDRYQDKPLHAQFVLRYPLNLG